MDLYMSDLWRFQIMDIEINFNDYLPTPKVIFNFLGIMKHQGFISETIELERIREVLEFKRVANLS